MSEVLMPLCLHRWSTIKRWHDRQAGLYRVIQRCRKCEQWVRRDVDMKNETPQMSVEVYVETATKRLDKTVGSDEIPKVDGEQ